MKPISPVIPGYVDPAETIFGQDQPEYIPLPAWRDSNGRIVTRWNVGFRERLRILLFGDIWLTMLTFNQPLQPVMLDAKCPVEPDEYEDEEYLTEGDAPWTNSP